MLFAAFSRRSDNLAIEVVAVGMGDMHVVETASAQLTLSCRNQYYLILLG